MFEAFIAYHKKEELLTSDDKILLTVSSGIDSMCMLHLFMLSDFRFGIAHCNFQLRGIESDEDEKFVAKFAQQNKFPFHSKIFDTEAFAKTNKISIQMAARDLRYKWFAELASEYGYTKIATAHNRNDVVETFLINLTRGTGIKGLTGIKPKVNKIIRPILFATRKEIEDYSRKNHISFREDSSNADTKYLRNSIRHNIIPEFEKLNPSFSEAVIHSSEIVGEAHKEYSKKLEELKTNIFNEKTEVVELNKQKLIDLKVNSKIFFELLSPFGFTKDNTSKILKSLNSQPGKTFYSDHYQLIVDREKLLVSEKVEFDTKEYTIENPQENIAVPIYLENKILPFESIEKVPKSAKTASFDLNRLKFPLKIRRWKAGDYFYPFGMKGKKKLSDFFSDQKLSLLDKKKIWLLCSGKQIIWIVGHRIDNRYAVTKTTTQVFQIKLLD